MGEEVVRDTIVPQARDTIAAGMQQSPQSPLSPADDFAEQFDDNLNMPDYQNRESTKNYDDLI